MGIGMGLLGFASFFMLNSVIYLSRDIYDLQERGQFTVSCVLNFVSMFYFRLIVAVPGMYWFLYEEYAAMATSIRIVIIAYLIIFKAFDLFFIIFSANQTYGYLIGGKGLNSLKKSTKITAASLTRAPSTPLICLECVVRQYFECLLRQLFV